MTEQVDLEPERQQEILALEAKLDSANLFELLGVPAGASVDEVRGAFRELSLKFHPDRFFGKKLGSFKPKLDKIFRKLVEANQTLTDEGKRAAYLAANPFVRAAVRQAGNAVTPTAQAPKSAEEEQRDAERRARLARHPYLMKAGKVQEEVSRAKAALAKGEFSQAFTYLNQALAIDATHAEAKQLMVEVRRKNEISRCESDLKRAQEALERGDETAALAAYKSASNVDQKNFPAAYKAAALMEKRGGDPKEISPLAQRAVDADPKNVDARLLLARVLEAGGMKQLAKRHFEEATKLDPNHPEVKKSGKRLWPF